MSNIAAAIITIGDELLIGQTIDTNSAWIAQHLNELGIDVLRRVAVGDDRNAIIKALDEEIAGASLILITGGLGPTSDDITKPLLNEYFGGKMKVDERVLEHVKNIFARRDRPVLERNLKQAEVPDNCTVLFNKMGTAPGLWFEVPNSKFQIPNSKFQIPDPGKVVIAMPGVPFEMMSIMEDEALPRLRERFLSDALLHRTIITAGVGESYIAEKIQDLEEALPAHIKLAYLPDTGMVRLRLTGRAKDKELLAAELKIKQEEFANRLGNMVIALDDLPMEKILGDLLKEKGKTLGLAESCTGGFIGHHITQVSGSSEIFLGSIVSYSNDVKHNVLGVQQETLEQYGAVSEQTVIEMAKGALRVLGSDFALAVSGVLGPSGGTYRAPVGTVWMAVADKETITTKEFHFIYDRLRNKELAARMGMLLLWKFIKSHES
jgi:nicotinamide-nucleotide amidase